VKNHEKVYVLFGDAPILFETFHDAMDNKEIVAGAVK
jgi:hypothetical protein